MASPSSVPEDLSSALDRWVGAGLLTRDQASAIRAYETRPVAAPRRVSLLAEALGYAGAALATAGIAAALGRAWADWPPWAHLLVAVAAAAGALLGGALLRNQSEPAFARLSSVFWFLAVGATAWVLVVLIIEIADLPDGMSEAAVGLIISTGVWMVATLLWRLRPAVLQLGACFAASMVVAVTAALSLAGEDRLWAVSLAVWLVSAAWAWLGWKGWAAPAWAGLGLGAAGVLFGPTIGLGEYGWLGAIGLATAAFLMAASVPSRQLPLLGLGTVGLFGFVTWAVVRYFGESLGVPVALVLVGVVFLALAVVAGRLSDLARGRKPRGHGPARTA